MFSSFKKYFIFEPTWASLGEQYVLVAAYNVFLLSLALEWKVNLLRTIALLGTFFTLWKEPSLRSAVLHSRQVRIASFFPVIALCAWLIGPYGEEGLKTFDWLICLLIGFAVAHVYGKKAIILLFLFPVTVFIASLYNIVSHWIFDGNLAALFQLDLKMKLYNESANRMGFTLAAGASLTVGIFPLLKRHRAFLLLIFCILSFLCWYTQSRSAVFSLIGTLGIAFLFFLYYDTKQGILILFFFSLILCIAFLFIGGNRIPQTITNGSWDFLLNGRGDIWQAAWEIFQQSPIVGFGVNSFRHSLEFLLNLPANAGRFPDIRAQYIFWNAHQMVLGILCETGLAGLFVFGILIWQALRDGLTKFPESFAPLLLLVVFLIAGLGGYGFHRSWNSAFFFLAIGLLDGLRGGQKGLFYSASHQQSQSPAAEASPKRT